MSGALGSVSWLLLRAKFGNLFLIRFLLALKLFSACADRTDFFMLSRFFVVLGTDMGSVFCASSVFVKWSYDVYCVCKLLVRFPIKPLVGAVDGEIGNLKFFEPFVVVIGF